MNTQCNTYNLFSGKQSKNLIIDDDGNDDDDHDLSL